MTSKVESETSTAKGATNPKTGLPLIDDAAIARNSKLAAIGAIVAHAILQGIGLGIAILIMMFGNEDRYKMNIDKLKNIV